VQQCGVQRIVADIKKGAATEVRAVPDVGGRELGNGHRGGENPQLADHPVGDHPGGHPVLPVVDEHPVLHDDPSGRAGRGQYRRALGGADRQRFLDQHVLTGGQCRPGLLGVVAGGHRDVDRVHGLSFPPSRSALKDPSRAGRDAR